MAGAEKGSAEDRCHFQTDGRKASERDQKKKEILFPGEKKMTTVPESSGDFLHYTVSVLTHVIVGAT